MINYPKNRKLKTHCMRGHELGPENRDRWNRCRICISEAAKRYHREHPHRESGKHNRDRHIYNTYGLTPDDYQKLLNAQGRVCAICGEVFVAGKGGRDPVVDHNHATGNVRGILHRSCNMAIGLLRDNPVFVDSAARYLRDRG